MARVPDPTGSMTPEMAELYQRLVGQRGRIDGMYRSLLNHPRLTRLISDLGAFLRFESGALPGDLRELAILWVARRLHASYEWVKHTPPARVAGLPEPVIEAIRTGQAPPELTDEQQAVIEVVNCVLEKRSIPQGLQDGLAARIGLPGVIEIVVIVGFYQMIAGVIFAFDVPLPEGMEDPLI